MARTEGPNRQGIEERASFDRIRYANCWEDPRVLAQALAPAPGKRILSVASAGDNSFTLAAAGAEVVAADLSPAQLALVELKRAALRRLEQPEVLAFLGLEPSADRLRTYRLLEGDLPGPARAFWESHPAAVSGGVAHSGRFEGYFRLFRRWALPLVHRRRTVERLLEPRDEAERGGFYRTTWDTPRWRLLFRVFFSRRVMGRLGRDPEFFRFVEGSVSERILARARHALTALPTTDNPFVEYILRGTFRRALPDYLRPESYAAVREGLGRLEAHLGPVEEVAAAHRGRGFDGFNLSDVFEYLDPEACREIFARLLPTARPGARLAYWNLLVPRSCPRDLGVAVRSLEEEARALHARDRAFFYGAFVLEEVG